MGMTPKSERYRMEMTLHKTRADLEELKHDLHTQQMELTILEGKTVNQEDSLASLKKETIDVHQVKLDSYYAQIANLEKKFLNLEKKLEEILLQVAKLTQTGVETHKALAQNKERLNELEKAISVMNKSTTEITKLKKNVDAMAKMCNVKRPFTVDIYKVKLGETLESIAERHSTTVDTLQKINQLESKKLLLGQEIFVPITGDL